MPAAPADPDLDPADLEQLLLRDVVQQTDELGALVTDIVHAGETTVPPDEAQDRALP